MRMLKRAAYMLMGILLIASMAGGTSSANPTSSTSAYMTQMVTVYVHDHNGNLV